MVPAVLHVVPVLAEKDKTAFYICAAALVAWAIIVSVGFGLRRPEFPGGVAGQRAVITVSVLLVAATMTTAVVTAQTPQPASASASTGSSAPASGPGSTLTESAAPNGDLRFTRDALHASPGRVVINFTNMAPEMHNMTIALGTKVLAATPTFQGGTKVLSVDLKPGTYVFYCSVPGHRQAGMQGTLTVG